ncbi:MAG: septum formation initiator family protein [Elusimicrobiales bacterium]|nr:septum formation initiator family protein [Elusimicrobiales bacterium]
MAKYIRYLIFIASAVFLLANRDFRNLVHNSLELKRLQRQEAKLDEESRALQAEKARLLNTKDDYLERLARQNLSLVKPGEVEFRFPASKPSGK